MKPILRRIILIACAVFIPFTVDAYSIIIDPGHGGKDPGAISPYKGEEKAIVLQISKKVSAAIKAKLPASTKVILTRPNDTFLTLAQRNKLANKNSCDVFLSIHGNSAPNKSAKGIEIYYLNKATDQASKRLADRENQGAPSKESDMDAILSDLIQTASTEESSILAKHMKKRFQKIQSTYDTDVKIKTALFYVLVGAKCPSLLIETGFLTNREEVKRLKKPAFQKEMANAIAQAVVDYLTESENSNLDL